MSSSHESFVNLNEPNDKSKKLIEDFENGFKKNQNDRIILEAIQHFVNDQHSPYPELQKKVERIFFNHEVSKLTFQNSEPLLGLTLDSEELSDNEGHILRICLTGILKSKYESSLKNKNSMLNNSNKDDEEIELLETKKQLNDVENTFAENQFKYLEILEELKKLKLEEVPKLVKRQLDHVEAKSNLNSLKAETLIQKNKIDMLTKPDEGALTAFDEVLKDIREQTKAIQKEIEELTELKNKYDEAMKSSEYREILKSYVGYKKALEKKKEMYHLLENN